MSKLYPNLSKLDKARLDLFARIPHCAPDFMPDKWDGIDVDIKEWGFILAQNNCYAYGVNDPSTRRIRSGRELPGIGINSVQKVDLATLNSHKKFISALRADGIIFAGRKKPQAPPPGCYAIAAFSCDVGSKTHRSFHFYRLDRDGYWSHKCGTGPVWGDYQSGKAIEDPRAHVHHEKPYDGMQFIGYFYVPNSGIALGRQDSILPVQTSDPLKRQTPLQQPDRVQRSLRARFEREDARDAR